MHEHLDAPVMDWHIFLVDIDRKQTTLMFAVGYIKHGYFSIFNRTYNPKQRGSYVSTQTY